MNYTETMYGLQIGLVNIIHRKETLPVFVIANWSFYGMRRNPLAIASVLGAFYAFYVLRGLGRALAAIIMGLPVTRVMIYKVLPGFDVFSNAWEMAPSRLATLILAGPACALLAGYLLLVLIGSRGKRLPPQASAFSLYDLLRQSHPRSHILRRDPPSPPRRRTRDTRLGAGYLADLGSLTGDGGARPQCDADEEETGASNKGRPRRVKCPDLISAQRRL